MIVGGASPAALRRAITHGQGWYGFAMDVSAAEKSIEGIQLAKARSERPAELGELSISITPPRPLTKTMLDDYEGIGVDRVIPMLGFYSGEEVLSALDGLAKEVL